MKNIQEKLIEVVKIQENLQFHFQQILNYIDSIKKYEINSPAFRCEWLDPVIMKNIITNETEEYNNIPHHQKIGNIITCNYLKVQKMI
jgi:hypothetical protein